MHFALLISSYRFKQSLQWTYCNFLGMSTFNWHLILGKPTHDHLGNNEKTDFGQNQLPTYEETQISISPHFNNGSVNDKPAPFVEQVTLVKSGSDGLRFRWSCLADKKTGAKKIFVLDFRQEESAKGMVTPTFIKTCQSPILQNLLYCTRKLWWPIFWFTGAIRNDNYSEQNIFWNDVPI